MQEVLSRNPDSSNLPDGEQFIELRLSDIGPDETYPSYWVMETVSQWVAANKRLVEADPQLHCFTTLEEAPVPVRTLHSAMLGSIKATECPAVSLMGKFTRI